VLCNNLNYNNSNQNKTIYSVMFSYMFRPNDHHQIEHKNKKYVNIYIVYIYSVILVFNLMMSFRPKRAAENN
jgi:hypothetical protein